MDFKKGLSKLYNEYQKKIFPFTTISNKKKLIFIHIPKAAGTAVRVAIGEPEKGRRHLPWWVYQQADPRKFEQYFKFAFVRNPETRALSGFNYLKNGGNKTDDLEICKYLTRYQSFSDFLEAELLEGNMINHPIFRPQSWYLCDWHGRLKVDHLGYFESLNKDCSAISKVTGIRELDRLPEVNRTSNTPNPIDDKSKELIRKIYKSDFSIFGY